MQKMLVKQPVVIYMYGAPGAGKSFVARQLAETLGLAHISSERIHNELFEETRNDKAAQKIVLNLMHFMAEQFLQTGVSVIYDVSFNRQADRREVRDLARKGGAKDLMLWMQLDTDTALGRASKRDRRKVDDKYAAEISKDQFDGFVSTMQPPQAENYLVLSGKHSFNTQKNAIFRRLSEMGVVTTESLSENIAKPEMVNLVSQAQAQAGRGDYLRRNIILR